MLAAMLCEGYLMAQAVKQQIPLMAWFWVLLPAVIMALLYELIFKK